MKIVSPFRPFPPESDAHIALGAFDWHDALLMLEESARRFSQCDVFVITDVDTSVPVQAYTYETKQRRLMLWILEVSLRYLESDDFNEDTVMVSPDILVLGDLRPFFRADLGIIVRFADKHVASGRTLLNSVQWWCLEAKTRLVALYRTALTIACRLPADVVRWGADTVPLQQLLSPFECGRSERNGLSVFAVDARESMTDFSRSLLRKMRVGHPFIPETPLLDFRYLRKRHMREFFDAASGAAVTS